jgi:FkbH-like protein
MEEQVDLINTLRTENLPLASLIKVLKTLDQSIELDKTIKFGISSNIRVDQLGIFLKKHAYISQVSAEVVQGGYDNHLDNIDTFIKKNVDTIVLINFFDNLLPSFESQLENLDQNIIEAQKDKIADELDLILDKAKGFKDIYITLFTQFSKPSVHKYNQKIIKMITVFNNEVKKITKKYLNVKTLDTSSIVFELGHANTYDYRFYYQLKAPFTNNFHDQLSKQIILGSRCLGSYFYKAIVLDCDNTLWKGIIGEDLIDGIELSPYDYPGNIFWYAQQEILKMQKNGIVLCLCSKNNPQDVNNVLKKHPFQVIKDQHLVIKKINWNDKPQNLEAIARELNIGLDSIIFLDDSPFECESMRYHLPMVKTLQVPKNLHDYLNVINELKEFVLTETISREDINKTKQYKTRMLIENEKKKFSNQDDYLKSLELKALLRKDNSETIHRVSELTQKSNQFNLTTNRYSKTEIESFLRSDYHSIYSLNVSDKFGDSGLTGVVLAIYKDNTIIIDSFLMSCRVIGRGIEFSIWNEIIKDAKIRNCKYIKAEYLKTAKNEQVTNFFDTLGIPLQEENLGNKSYFGKISELKLNSSSHVKVVYEKSR